MDFKITETQQAVVDAIASAVERQGSTLPGCSDKFVLNPEFARSLREQGYWDIVREEDFGLFGAVLMIEGLARSPYCLEITGSALVWPALGLGEAPETVALAQAPLGRPVRFAAAGNSVVVLEKDSVRVGTLAKSDVELVESHFAYPLGRVLGDVVQLTEAPAVDPSEVRLRWSLGIGAEIVGAAAAALDITVQHVKDRTLFGKPLGSLQVVQHRLSACAVSIAAAQWLVYRAALRPNATNAAQALTQAQEAASLVSRECQQFHGAIGLTLEHPLHHWTYRLKFLASELGGIPANLAVAAAAQWQAGAEIRDPLAEVDASWI